MEENIFEQMAHKYDTKERIELATIVREKVKQQIKNAQAKTLLDYGSGTGLVSLPLSPFVRQLYLVDSSKQMTKVAEAKMIQQKRTNVKAVSVDLTKDKWMYEKVDVILISLVLLHIPDTQAILNNLHPLLNEGGQLLIVDFDKNEHIQHPTVHNGFSHIELDTLLEKTGWSEIQIETFYSGEKLFMNQDASMFLAKAKK